jgi:hypothetical protein
LICGFIIIFTGVYLLNSIARSSLSGNHHLHGNDPSEDDEADENERFLMEEAALLEDHEAGSSSLNLSGLNHDSDDDIELVMRPKTGH